MKVVVDTNVLMAGLLKDAMVREVLTSSTHEFYLPQTALDELESHRDELCGKSGFSQEELSQVLASLLERITLVEESEFDPFMMKAEEVMREIDVKDAPFVATCLAVQADGIWSFDNHFKKQSVVRIFSVDELRDGSARSAA